MTLIANCLTSHAEMERCFSSYGLTACSDHNQSGLQDDDVVDDCANQGSYDVLNYAGHRYSQAALYTHTTAREWATLFACYKLSYRRGNPVNEAFSLAREEAMAQLKLIPSGAFKLFGLAERGDLRPTWSNVQVDRRHRHSTIRVTQPNSSDAPTQLTQDHLREGPVLYD